MSDEGAGSRLHIDSDWKTEAAREKERLAEAEKASEAKGEAGKGAAAPSFNELVNLLAMQAAIALGGYREPGGGSIPQNPAAAKHHIDLLDVLDKKTRGNLNEEEKRTLDGVLYELRMQYVQMVSGGASPAQPGK